MIVPVPRCHILGIRRKEKSRILKLSAVQKYLSYGDFRKKEKATSKFWKLSNPGNFQFIQFLYEYFSLEWFVFRTGKNRSVNQMSETYEFPRIFGVSHATQNGYSRPESGESEFYRWLSSISQGLNPQRLAAEFERKGF